MPSTPSKRTENALLDIRDNIAFARSFVQGMTLEQFIADRRTVYATTRALEIVSEAVRRLPNAFRTENPAPPWKNIIGAGNIYRHNYDDVDDGIVWFTVQDELSPLLAVVEAALAAPDP